ncbi:putative thioesterase [Geodermatophilus bullaregiensis]|uniref:thioesterase family protein n=1 Tax=Geodermatophilus bullaregiensis TaxID=1564160 RepID=UPI00195EBFFC|nr:thioesterase [Geodermatophilus bullaregiensis]MBM7807868.1 putative thioesterase [Geodermatophilus bullaregiensis]
MRPVAVGEAAVLDVVVTEAMTVDFDELGRVHPVYATYSMARHFEEAGRKLLLRYLEPGEEGIGTAVCVEHLAPAWVGDRIRVTARCTEVHAGRLTCALEAVDASGRLLGRGTTGQAVLPADVVAARLARPAAPG